MTYYFLGLDPSLVGLSLAYTITLIGMFQYCVRVSAEVENLVRSSINETEVHSPP